MIEFDDAGIGCTILGEVYVARRIETNEVVTDFLHVNERNERPLVDVLYKMLLKLQPKEGEEIFLCRGEHSPRAYSLMLLADSLKCPPIWLFEPSIPISEEELEEWRKSL